MGEDFTSNSTSLTIQPVFSGIPHKNHLELTLVETA